jgi:hypothetical protein
MGICLTIKKKHKLDKPIKLDLMSKYIDKIRKTLIPYKNNLFDVLDILILYGDSTEKTTISQVLKELQIKANNINLEVDISKQKNKLPNIVILPITFIIKQFFVDENITQIHVNSTFFLKRSPMKVKDKCCLYILYNHKIIETPQIEDIVNLVNLKEYSQTLNFVGGNSFKSDFQKSITSYFQFVRNCNFAFISSNDLFFVYYIGFYLTDNTIDLSITQNFRSIHHLTPFAIFVFDVFWIKDLFNFNQITSCFESLFCNFEKVFVIFEVSSDQNKLVDDFKQNLKTCLLKFENNNSKLRIMMIQTNQIICDYTTSCLA